MPYLRRRAALPAPKADIDSLAGFRGRQDLFGQPALAGDNRYADLLRGYLRSETIAPLPLQRLAAAYPGRGVLEDPAAAGLHLDTARR